MSRKRFLPIVGVFYLLVALSIASAESEITETKLLGNDGAVIGSLKIQKASGGVLINLKAESLKPGRHGMHFHQIGNCEDHAGFKNAKGHIAPDNAPHGFLHSKGPHAGNLPNLIVASDGKIEVELYSNLVSYDAGDSALLDEDGSALIIHQNQDDHITQPIGGSGPRVACGVLERKS
ncbi:UNVERIFIED_CONTAM: hypothetical protein GTU68_059052 [Idotea baltica]|nr:hypothetical protein [Idotea baltica]